MTRRWQTWQDLLDAAAEGDLVESQVLELKKDVGSTKEAKKELARDLASLAAGGGVLLLGVSCRQQNGLDVADEVVGVGDAASVMKRVIDVAQNRVDPPLVVDVELIAHPDRPEAGCVVVTVPSSVDAPHMADERYWGRNARGKAPLGDAAVHRMMRQRHDIEETFRSDLVAMAPNEWELPRDCRLVLRAAPVTSQSLDLTVDTALICDLLGRRYHPLQRGPFGGSSRPTQRPSGAEVASLDTSDGAQWFQVGVADEGTISVEATGLTGSPGGVFDEARGGNVMHTALKDPGRIIDLACATARLAGEVAAEAGYVGQWRVGVRLTGIHQVLLRLPPAIDPSIVGFPDQSYTDIAAAPTRTLQETPGVLADQLLRGFFRVYGCTVEDLRQASGTTTP